MATVLRETVRRPGTLPNSPFRKPGRFSQGFGQLLTLLEHPQDLKMIALAFAALLSSQDPYGSLGEVVGFSEPWAHIEVQGWTYAGRSSDDKMLAFFMPHRQTGKLWMRYEYRQPTRSSRGLAELDCAGWRTRLLQVTDFAQSNLEGDGATGISRTWSDAAPGTFAETALEFGCAD